MRKRYALFSSVVGFAGIALTVLSHPDAVVHAADKGAKAGAPHRATDRVPVVVELFTSEGCSSCPPADDVLARLEQRQPVRGARVVPLAFHVDYWDELGWPDPFASPAHTARQHSYATLGRMYTPQAVVDGKAELVGSRERALEQAVAKAALREHAQVSVNVAGNGGSFEVTVHVGPLPKLPNAVRDPKATIFIALTQAHAKVPVARGENGGRTLRHTAIVRQLVAAGLVDERGGDARATLRAPAGAVGAGLRAVAFVQRRQDRQVVGSEMRVLGR